LARSYIGYKVNNTMRLRRLRFKFFRGQTGFSLLEALVAVGILGLIGAGLLRAFDTNARATRTLDEKVVGSNLATAYFEAIKAMPYYTNVQDYLNDVTIQNITVPPQYNVNVDIAFTSDGATGDGITWVDTYTDETLQKISVSVSREGGKPVFSICAFKTKRSTD